jgi:hypothetical protein
MLIYQNVNSYPLKKCVTISFHVSQLQQTGVMGNFTSILNNYLIMLNFIKEHIYTYYWKFYLLIGAKIFKIGFDWIADN